ncbi:hypothetical protein CR513_07684, partial [Mucuna pruriens]
MPPQGEDFQSAKMLQLLEERMNALKGTKQSDFDVADLCLFPNIVVPPKFELSAFDKYKGTTCPKNHLIIPLSVAKHGQERKGSPQGICLTMEGTSRLRPASSI